MTKRPQVDAFTPGLQSEVESSMSIVLVSRVLTDPSYTGHQYVGVWLRCSESEAKWTVENAIMYASHQASSTHRDDITA